MQLVNADQPYWLIGITEMTRTFGLELLESVLTNFSSVFFKVFNHNNNEFICHNLYIIIIEFLIFSASRI